MRWVKLAVVFTVQRNRCRHSDAYPSFPRRRESTVDREWTLAYAGVTTKLKKMLVTLNLVQGPFLNTKKDAGRKWIPDQARDDD